MADTTYTPVAGDFELLTGRDVVADENFASKGYWKGVDTIFFRNRRAVVGLVLVLAVIALAVLGPLLSPYAYDQIIRDPVNEATVAKGIAPPGMAQGPFAGTSIPELVDFGVLEKFRARGIGSKLMDVAERIAAERADTLCLGVGLHRGYGSAQRLYARRGYVPDGSGAWYRDAPCAPYEKLYAVDDDLVLYLSKKLR